MEQAEAKTTEKPEESEKQAAARVVKEEAAAHLREKQATQKRADQVAKALSATDKDTTMDFGGAEEKPMSQVTVTELENLIHETYQLQDRMEEKQREVDEAQKFLSDRKAKLLAIFQSFGKTSYRTSRGLVVRQKRFNVTMPKDPAEKMKFFSFLQERGIFKDMVTVNHQTLNAFYKTEMEAAVAKGDIDFAVPGVGEPKYQELLALRRTR